MSLAIIQSGIFDTIQDTGRYGYQHLGINPGGAIDRYSAQLSNALLGKDLNSPVIELHFPAASVQFQKKTIICITGANFTPVIDEKDVPVNRPIIVNDNCTLQFRKLTTGARCYMSVLHDLHLNKWLNSYSTNIKANIGGLNGRELKKGDVITYRNSFELSNKVTDEKFFVLSWGAAEWKEMVPDVILYLRGTEWNLLMDNSKITFTNSSFKISGMSDRMGYRLQGEKLQLKQTNEFVSSGVTFGTVQLPPDGQPIILMADHQTTGGYARIAHIISAHLPALAQKQPGDLLKFQLTDIQTAEASLVRQQKHLQQVQRASTIRVKHLFSHHDIR